MTDPDKDTRTRLEKILDGLDADLDHIHDDLGWTHSLGWDAPAQLKTQSQRGASLARPTDDQDEDHVAGATHDTGLGDHRARNALRTAAPRLVDIARHLALAVQTIQPDAELRIPAKPTDLHAMQAAARLSQHRARTIRRLIAGLDPRRQPGGLERPILDAHAKTRSTRGLLAGALDRGPATTDTEPNPDMCRVCGIRPIAPRKARRCTTCHQWYYRHGKRERPTALDQADVDAARQAKARRRARGDGYGAA